MKYILILISFLFVLTCSAQTKRLIYEDGSTAGIVEEKDLILKHSDTVVVVIDGQSNSIGQQSQSAKTYSQKNVQVWTGSAWTNTLQTGSNPFNANGANNIGLQFALKLAKMRPTSLVRLIASGNSGQPISYWLSSPYTGFINTDNLVLNAIGNAKVDVFIWVQGESDYNRSRTQYISDYYTLRSQGWLLTSWYTQNTRHINVGLYDGSSNVYGFHNETLKQIGSDSIVQTSYAPVFGLGVYDNIHWNNTAIDTIGQERVYNAYLSTPYAFQQKMTRISQVESELSVSESLKENLLILRSNADSTAQNQNQNTIFFDGKYWSGASSASADNYSDAAITSYKDNVNGAGGAGLLFRTSSSGAGGLQIKARINKEGVFDALGGFRINGQAQNNLFMVGNGSIFSGRSLSSSDVTTALSPTNRFVFANANLATMTINGGDGTSGTNGAYVLFKKDNVSNFFLGNESAAFGGTTNNAVAFVYGSNAFRIATNSTRQFSVEGNGNVLIGSMSDNGNKFQVTGNITGSNIIQGLSLYSTATTGTAPLNVLSTTLVNNLNVALLNGQNAAYYTNATNINAGTLADARLSSNAALKNIDNNFSVAQSVAAATTANHALQLGQFNTAVSGLTNTYAKFNGTNSVGNALLKDDVNGTYFESSAIERLRMHTDGRVNIGGITNRYSKVNVLGGINADSLKVNNYVSLSGPTFFNYAPNFTPYQDGTDRIYVMKGDGELRSKELRDLLNDISANDTFALTGTTGGVFSLSSAATTTVDLGVYTNSISTNSVIEFRLVSGNPFYDNQQITIMSSKNMTCGQGVKIRLADSGGTSLVQLCNDILSLLTEEYEFASNPLQKFTLTFQYSKKRNKWRIANFKEWGDL